MSTTSPTHFKPSIFGVVVVGLASLLLIVSVALWHLSSSKPAGPAVLGDRLKPGALVIDGPNQVKVHRRFTLELIADTSDQPVNAVGIYFDFDPLYLYIEDVDTTQSFCQFYPENKVNNQVGKFGLACGAPNPGFSGRDTIAKVTFVSKNTGRATLKFDPRQTMILLNDGKGTNIFRDALEYTIHISNEI